MKQKQMTMKVTESAVVFLVIFLLLHLLEEEFLVKNWRLIKAFGVSRVILIGFLLTV